MRHKGSRIEKSEPASAQPSDKVVDLMAVLRRSLDERGSRAARQASATVRTARHGKTTQRRRA